MADENELKELINQAIACEHPHVYGTVNLNRLREVLCLLVSARYEESFIANLSNQSFDEETKSFQGIVREVSKEELACNSLQDVSNALTSVSQELDQHKANLNTTCRSPSPKDVEQSCTLPSLENILAEIEEVTRKVNEINERVSKLETKLPPEQYQCTCNCGVLEDGANLSESNASHAGRIPSPKPSTQPNVSEMIFDVERDVSLNDVQDLRTTCEVVPSAAARGNSTPKSASVQSAGSALKDFKNTRPFPTDAGVSVKQDNGGVNGEHIDEESTLPSSSEDTVRDEVVVMVEERSFSKFDHLLATVDGLVERENMFLERLSNIEKLMSSCIAELYTRLQGEKCVPPTVGFDKNNIVQNLQKESGMSNVPESVHQKSTRSESLLEANIRSIIDEQQKEICFLKMAFNRLNIAAGGRTDAEIKTHIQCISCNCAAAMEIHEELIPTPVPLHVRRCMKPMLRRQLDWIGKELKCSAIAPQSMQPYYQLLKNNKLLPPK